MHWSGVRLHLQQAGAPVLLRFKLSTDTVNYQMMIQDMWGGFRWDMWGPSTSPNTGKRRDSKRRRKRVRFADEAFAFFPFSVVDENELSVFDLI